MKYQGQPAGKSFLYYALALAYVASLMVVFNTMASQIL
jgi:hypothetical protein